MPSGRSPSWSKVLEGGNNSVSIYGIRPSSENSCAALPPRPSPGHHRMGLVTKMKSNTKSWPKKMLDIVVFEPIKKLYIAGLVLAIAALLGGRELFELVLRQYPLLSMHEESATPVDSSALLGEAKGRAPTSTQTAGRISAQVVGRLPTGRDIEVPSMLLDAFRENGVDIADPGVVYPLRIVLRPDASPSRRAASLIGCVGSGQQTRDNLFVGRCSLNVSVEFEGQPLVRRDLDLQGPPSSFDEQVGNAAYAFAREVRDLVEAERSKWMHITQSPTAP